MNSKIPSTPLFCNVSIIIAAFNETVSLRKTVEIIYDHCDKKDLAEIIIAVSKRSSPECLQTCDELAKEAQVPLSILIQKRPFAGGAYQDAFEVAKGSHAIMIASDLETDPLDVPNLIAASKEHPDHIICTSRWRERGRFGKGYNAVKYILNYIFQKLMRLFFGANLSDWTFGYRLFPCNVIKNIKWEELRHPFFLETILKPLRLGVPTIEISTSWAPRQEGESQNPFWRNFLYFKTVFRALFCDKSTFLK